MGDGDDLLRPLPGGGPLQVHHAVLRHQVVDGGAGVGGDGAVGEGGDDAAFHLSVLARHGGGQADEALAPLGQVGPQDEVQLPAGARDVLEPGALGVHLAEQIHVHRVVDGDEVVQLGDDVDVIGVVHRRTHDLRVVVYVVVELLGARPRGVVALDIYIL